jgi:uncharacterized membrane-anchored protein
MTAASVATGTLTADHPLRRELNDEVHARPPESLVPPLRVSYLAVLSSWATRDRHWELVADLAARHGRPAPARDAVHHSVDLGPFRLKWERHTEFTRYTFIVAGAGSDPFGELAIAAVPADWLAAIPGEVMVAAHVAMLPAAAAELDDEAIAARWFRGNALVGGRIAGGAATAFTDFRIQDDRFSRFLVLDRGMVPRQAGRIVQRLLEIDTYRVLALLALPVARELTPALGRSERELAEITNALVTADRKDEPVLLDRLTRLEAEIESRAAESTFRFSAAEAYYDIVRRRIAELREERVPGYQTFEEFTERRLAPAMNTCTAAALRQERLSRRVARANQLLSTRIDITNEHQTQALLESMDRRALIQLRLQTTVESLSVAALTYYVVGLVGYAAKGAKAAGAPFSPDLAMAVAVPFVALVAWSGMRRMRRLVTKGAS